MIDKNKRRRSQLFLSWAKKQGGACSVHLYLKGDKIRSTQLHHYGEKGMGQKSDDYLVARVCDSCHAMYQGKRRIGFIRVGEVEVLEALEADNIQLLTDYVEELEQANARHVPRRCAACQFLGEKGSVCCATLPHVEPPVSCTHEELLQIALEHAEDESEDRVGRLAASLNQWVNRRGAEVFGQLATALRLIARQKVRVQGHGMASETDRKLAEANLNRNAMIAEEALKEAGLVLDVEREADSKGPDGEVG